MKTPSSIYLRIEKPEDFEIALNALKPFIHKIKESNKLTSYYEPTGNWLIGNSVLTNNFFTINFYVISQYKDHAEYGYLEFMGILKDH